MAIGANVLTYATNRELKEKLDAPQLMNFADDQEDNMMKSTSVPIWNPPSAMRLVSES